MNVDRQLFKRVLETLRQDGAGVLVGKDHQVNQEQVLKSILAILERDPAVLPFDRDQVAHTILNDVIGFGPLEPLLDDPDISEIMVNAYDQVWVERRGKITRTDVQFHDDEHIMRVIERIISPLGRRCDESSPAVDARLPDGSRVHAIIPPLALKGPTITIRKFGKKAISLDDLASFGSMSPDMVTFLAAAVKAGMNIIVSGGTGSGKTTLLNALSAHIPQDERIVTIEDAAELRLQQPHVVSLEARPTNMEGKGAFTIRDLLRNSLRMRPDRIVVGECRGGETLDMLQAMNTGHDGSLTTAHANSPRELISRLETMALMAGLDMPVRVLREQITGAINIIVQAERLRDGSRKVTRITEVHGMEGEVVVLEDIFQYRIDGVGSDGKVRGEHAAMGAIPRCLDKIRAAGINLEQRMFGGGSVW